MVPLTNVFSTPYLPASHTTALIPTLPSVVMYPLENPVGAVPNMVGSQLV